MLKIVHLQLGCIITSYILLRTKSLLGYVLLQSHVTTKKSSISDTLFVKIAKVVTKCIN